MGGEGKIGRWLTVFSLLFFGCALPWCGLGMGGHGVFVAFVAVKGMGFEANDHVF